MTTEKVTKNKIVLTRSDAKRLAQVGLSASAPAYEVPVLMAAHVVVEGNSARVTSTDRYRIHTGLVHLKERAKAHEFVIPRDALAWLDKNGGTWGRFQPDAQGVIITTSSTGALTITVKESMEGDARSVSWNGEVVKGIFPPVFDLLTKARGAEAGEPGRVEVRYLQKVAALADGRDAPLIKFTKPAPDSKKPGPVYLHFGDADAPYAEALIQPRLNVAS